jgi:uncharacterized protein
MSVSFRSPWLRRLLAFLLLFVFFQAPETIGLRSLHSRAAQAGLMVAFYVVALGTSHWLGYRGLGAYGLALHSRWGRLLGLTLLLGFAAKGLALAAGLHWHIYRLVPLAFPPTRTTLGFALVAALATTFLPSAAEDMLTRGLWRPLLQDSTGFVLFSSAVYVLNHVFRLANGPGEWVMLFSFGVVYATAFTVTGSLWAAIGLHWGWNLANVVPLLFVNLEVLQRGPSRALSAATHLALAAGILLLRRKIRPQPPPRPTLDVADGEPALQKASPAPR